MPADQYILSFNFAEISNQIAVVQSAYTDLGRAIKATTSDLISDFSSLTDQVESFKEAFSQASSISNQQYASFLQNATETSRLFETFAKNSKSITENFDKLKGIDLGNLGQKSTAERLEAVSPGLAEGIGLAGGAASETAKEAKKAADEALKIVKKARKDIVKLRKEAKGEILGLRGYIEKEMKNARSSMRSLATRSTPGGVLGGGIIGGMLSAIILGVSESQRQEKERGEMINTFEATGNVFSNQGRKAVRWFSNFQERAQRYYGITKNQTQAVIKSMVDAGYSVDEIMSKASKRMGDVHSNVATLSMGLDAYFGMASGRAMSGMTELVVEYGDSLKVAANKYTDLMFAAQSSGMGVNKFVDAVRSGSQALTQYGIDVKDVAESLLAVKKHYEDLGMTSQAAGTWAGKGAQAAAQGLAQSSQFNIEVMRRINPEMGVFEAKQALQEGWLQEDKAQRYGQFIKAAVEFVKEKVRGGEAEQKAYLEQEAGYSYLGASYMMTAYKENLDNQGRLVEATKEQMKELDKAFKTEGRTMSELQKVQHRLIDSIAKIGQGLLQVVTGIFGTIVTGFASVPMLIKALTLTGAEREKALQSIVDMNNTQIGNVVSGFDKTTAGGKMLAGVLGDQFEKIFPNFNDLKKLQDSIDKAVPRTTAEAGVEVIAGRLGVEDPRMFAEEFEKSAQDFFAPLNESVNYLLNEDRKKEYDRLRRQMETARVTGIEDITGLKPRPRPANKPISIKEPFVSRGSVNAPDKPVMKPSMSLPIFKGPSSVPSPKTTLSATTLHNSATSLQSTLASEISR